MAYQAAKKTAWSDSELAAAMKSNISGAFVFFGDEDYLKSYYRDAIAKSVLAEGLETFNDYRISFSPAAQKRDEAFSRLSDALSAMPMMQEKKLIVLSDIVPSALPEEAMKSLCEALAEAAGAGDTVLILYCRASEMVTDYKLESAAFYRKLSSCAQMVRFDLQPRGKLLGWIRRHLAEDKVRITDEAAELLLDLCAGRMAPLLSEMQKLTCFCIRDGESPTVTSDDVRKIVVPCDPDEVPFAMVNAAQSWRLSEMMAVLDAAKEQREEPIAVLSRLSRIYLDMLIIKAYMEDATPVPEIVQAMKMNEFRLNKYRGAIAKVPISVIERAVTLAYETDLKMKSLPTDPWVLLDEMAVNLYAPKSLRCSPQGVAP